ncbi:unnamed protein product [Timema podura]|uniref:Digestive organ expansion factor homolog n=2 Tax=Timema TaxID=61471 RepID=A0ABN7NP89_TIMPD|nr:unnamed protein product [Timema podura]
MARGRNAVNRSKKQSGKKNKSFGNNKHYRKDKFTNKKHASKDETKQRDFRKFNHKRNDSENSNKRRKVDEEIPRKDLTDDESSELETDDFKQLLSTFGDIVSSQKKAVESDSDDSDSEDGESENDSSQSKLSSLVKDDQKFKSADVAEEKVESQYFNVGQNSQDDSEELEEEYNDTENVTSALTIAPELLDSVSVTPPKTQVHTENWPTLGRLIFNIPSAPVTSKKSLDKNHFPKVIIEEENVYAKSGTVPKYINEVNWSKLHVKTQISKNLSKANVSNLGMLDENNPSPLTPLQKELFSIVNSYQDLFYPQRNLSNGEEVRFIYCLHAVNHVLKTRLRILHHNAKLSRKDDVPEEFRDQGLVRPKVLILVPFKDSALRVVKMIMDILIPDEKANVMNKNRFLNEFGGNELIMPKKNPKPEDYEATFTGNTDDTFRIGLTVTKKSLKLYADFYSADIIVASPLGLRVIVGAEGETGRDYDFLASIEILVLDQTEIFFMQNWDHLLHILEHLHLQPRESHGTDFARVRSWAVNGWTRYYRQSMVFSSLTLPEMNSLFNKKCHNYAGKVRVINPVISGTICQVVVQLPQVFQKLQASSSLQLIEARFDYFVKKVLPQYKDSIMSHVLVFIPSYFDYVRIRNYFKREDMSFVQICEYSKENKIARARDMFFHDEAHFLLYSERFHFFNRLRIKGIRHILFYQPPTFPHFYSEMCNLMQVIIFYMNGNLNLLVFKKLSIQELTDRWFLADRWEVTFFDGGITSGDQEANQSRHSGADSNMTVTVLYSKYDVQQLAAVVGTERASRMVSSERNVHMFMTGD